MSAIKCTFLAVALLMFGAAGWSAAASSPQDAGGAAWSSQWTRYDWNASSGKQGASSSITGAGSGEEILEIASTSADDARFVREVTVEPETVYHFYCRLRTEQVGTGARGAGISVLGTLHGAAINGTSKGWVPLDFYGKTGKDQKKISVTVGIGGYGSLNTGKAWFKEVLVTKEPSPPKMYPIVPLQPEPVAAPASATSSGLPVWIVIGALGCLGVLLLACGQVLRRRGTSSGPGTGTTSGPGAGLSTGPRSGPPVRPGAGEGRGAVPPVEGNKRGAVAFLVAITTACLLVSLINLGSFNVPETGWQSALPGEYITVELGRETDLSRIYYYAGINGRAGDASRFTLSARQPGGAFLPLTSFVKDQVGAWQVVEVAARTSAIRISADIPGGRLNELAFLEKGKKAPVAGVSIGATSVSPHDQGVPKNLIDEQSCFEYAPSYRTGFYFDEIYHARTAWEMLHGIEPYETTHPPLGKLLIASGIALFGMNAFGWRIVGTLFGVALLPLSYLFGVKLFRNRFYACAAAFLLSVDFMRFAQTRVAVIDIYGVFFILALYYLLLDLFPAEGERPSRSTNATLLLAGVIFGIGAACKWIVLYAGGGMLLLVALRSLGELKRRDFPPGYQAGGFLLRRISLCLLAFGIIPAVIYLLAYIPWLALPGPGHGVWDVVGLQKHMLEYHRMLHAEHPFASPWWSWPLDLRPVWMYTGSGLPQGMASTIACFGNPAIFWMGIPAVAYTVKLAWQQKNARLGVVLTALSFQYLPWVGVNRLVFIYHFFSSVPFVIFCLVATMKYAAPLFPRARAVTWGYLASAAALFILFYPALSGLEVSQGYIAHLRWLPSWLF